MVLFNKKPYNLEMNLHINLMVINGSSLILQLYLKGIEIALWKFNKFIEKHDEYKYIYDDKSRAFENAFENKNNLKKWKFYIDKEQLILLPSYILVM